MAGRVKRKAALLRAEAPDRRRAAVAGRCALCGRPLGERVEWHHAVPKSEGGRETVPVHPICHRTIHTCASNAELARDGGDFDRLRERPAMARFLAWISGKPPDFHAPVRRGR